MELRRARILRLLTLLLAIMIVSVVVANILLYYHYDKRKYEGQDTSHGQRATSDWIEDNSGSPIKRADKHEHEGDKSMKIKNIVNKNSHDDLNNDIKFDIKGDDIIVFLHIQKTGGTTFGKHLVQDLDIEQPCICNEDKKKCKCVRPDAKSDEELWLVSRYSTGWKCGLHADWTELNDCLRRESTQVENQSLVQYEENHKIRENHQNKPQLNHRYLFVTFLREPIRRFISEFKHVQRGATWKSSRHLCSGRPPTYEELPLCYNGTNWKDVTIEEFLSCKSNLAFNRQTRMLANLTLINCYNHSSMDSRLRDDIMLDSAKENLESMAFFGICDYQEASQILFERKFGMRFKKPFIQSNETRTSQVIGQFSAEALNTIEKLNHLDMRLYDYAVQLFLRRFQSVKPNTDLEMNDLMLVKTKNSSLIQKKIDV